MDFVSTFLKDNFVEMPVEFGPKKSRTGEGPMSKAKRQHELREQISSELCACRWVATYRSSRESRC